MRALHLGPKNAKRLGSAAEAFRAQIKYDAGERKHLDSLLVALPRAVARCGLDALMGRLLPLLTTEEV